MSTLIAKANGRVVLRKVYGSEQQTSQLSTGDSYTDLAIAVREKWMREMGIPEDEIAEACNPDVYPADLAEETDDLAAVKKIKALNRARKEAQLQ